MRLIDADVLIDHLLEVIKTANYFGNAERVSEINGCIGVIKSEKTIETPHGEWIENKKYNRRGKRFLNCSVCHYGDNGDIVCHVSIVPNFCPNCGADMRKEGDEK